MAGGKESPRQKMIGMMYLVLTALLALQVSSAIIEKFIFLNDSLEYTVGEADKRNSGTVDRIKKAVDERPQDAAVLKSAQQVREMTGKMIADIDALKKTLVAKSGGTNPETGEFVGAKDEESVAMYMISGKHDGEAYSLKKKLNQFSEDLSKHNNGKFPKLALDGLEDPMFKDKPDQKNKDFAELNFEHTPMVAALAVLSQKQSEIRRMESQSLEYLASKVGAGTFKVDQVFAMASPESKVVAAGTKYEAKMFIAASFKGMKPSMKYNGASIPVDGEGRGTVSFVARAGNYDADGNSKQSWTGTVTLKSPTTGKDTTYTMKEEFIVAKPVIQVQSASVQALYLNCGNELNIQVPALGSTYDPAFTASGASVSKGASKGLVTVVPTAGEVVINVSSGGNALGSEKFRVRPIPKPSIELFSNGAPVNLKQGVPSPGPRSLEIRAIAEEGFKAFLPKDARYRVQEWEITLARGKRPVRPTMKVAGAQVSIAALAADAKPGDRLVVEVKDVQRMNFQGKVEAVNIGTKTITIPLTD